MHAGYPTHTQLAAHPAMQASVSAMATATAGGEPLPSPVWEFLFPIVQVRCTAAATDDALHSSPTVGDACKHMQPLSRLCLIDVTWQVQALFSSRVHTPLHEAALGIIVPHVAPGLPLPRGKTLTLLYHLLSVVPAYRSECVRTRERHPLL